MWKSHLSVNFNVLDKEDMTVQATMPVLYFTPRDMEALVINTVLHQFVLSFSVYREQTVPPVL